jgi:hypothetical protein
MIHRAQAEASTPTVANTARSSTTMQPPDLRAVIERAPATSEQRKIAAHDSCARVRSRRDDGGDETEGECVNDGYRDRQFESR